MFGILSQVADATSGLPVAPSPKRSRTSTWGRRPLEVLPFQESLNRAIAHGVRPSALIGLGSRTCAAITVVADEHPDATADHIAEAYNAYAREHETDTGVRDSR
jgi:hypothetical protein